MITRLKYFLVGWLLVLGLKEGLVEYATVCAKSWLILKEVPNIYFGPSNTIGDFMPLTTYSSPANNRKVFLILLNRGFRS